MKSAEVRDLVALVNSKKDFNERDELLSQIQTLCLELLSHRRRICEEYGLDANWAKAEKIQFDLIPYIFETDTGNGDKASILPISIHENGMIRQLNIDLSWFDEDDNAFARRVKTEKRVELENDVASKTLQLELAKKKLNEFNEKHF